jgi:hypothetical protein
VNYELINNELIFYYESWMNIHINELHWSYESDICNTMNYEVNIMN